MPPISVPKLGLYSTFKDLLTSLSYKTQKRMTSTLACAFLLVRYVSHDLLHHVHDAQFDLALHALFYLLFLDPRVFVVSLLREFGLFVLAPIAHVYLCALLRIVVSLVLVVDL